MTPPDHTATINADPPFRPTTAAHRLLVPLVDLDTPAPRGAPLVAHPYVGGIGIVADDRPGDNRIEVLVYNDDSPTGICGWKRGAWLLDLSPPPTDAEGRPTRLDALSWAADILSSRFGEPDTHTAGHALQTMIAHMTDLNHRTTWGTFDMNTPRYWYRQWVERGGSDFLASVDVFDMAHPRREVIAMGLRARVGLEGGGDVS